MSDTMGNPETEDGVKVGLALMSLSGMRNEEACGINFGDIAELHTHPGFYYLRMYKTTVATGNTLKKGGKTRNAPRNIPIPTVLSRFLEERKKFVCE